MESKNELPIKKIGEKDWVENMTEFLKYYDVEVEGYTENISEEIINKFSLNEEFIKYYQNFGRIESSDFMYNLKKIDEIIFLDESIWSFVKENFSIDEIKDFIVFSESLANDPICYKKGENRIYLFSHDPIKKAIIFNSFNDYVLFELIQLQKLMGDVDFDGKEDEIDSMKKILDDSGVDDECRYMKM